MCVEELILLKMNLTLKERMILIGRACQTITILPPIPTMEVALTIPRVAQAELLKPPTLVLLPTPKPVLLLNP